MVEKYQFQANHKFNNNLLQQQIQSAPKVPTKQPINISSKKENYDISEFMDYLPQNSIISDNKIYSNSTNKVFTTAVDSLQQSEGYIKDQASMKKSVKCSQLAQDSEIGQQSVVYSFALNNIDNYNQLLFDFKSYNQLSKTMSQYKRQMSNINQIVIQQRYQLQQKLRKSCQQPLSQFKLQTDDQKVSPRQQIEKSQQLPSSLRNQCINDTKKQNEYEVIVNNSKEVQKNVTIKDFSYQQHQIQKQDIKQLALENLNQSKQIKDKDIILQPNQILLNKVNQQNKYTIKIDKKDQQSFIIDKCESQQRQQLNLNFIQDILNNLLNRFMNDKQKDNLIQQIDQNFINNVLKNLLDRFLINNQKQQLNLKFVQNVLQNLLDRFIIQNNSQQYNKIINNSILVGDRQQDQIKISQNKFHSDSIKVQEYLNNKNDNNINFDSNTEMAESILIQQNKKQQILKTNHFISAVLNYQLEKYIIPNQSKKQIQVQVDSKCFQTKIQQQIKQSIQQINQQIKQQQRQQKNKLKSISKTRKNKFYSTNQNDQISYEQLITKTNKLSKKVKQLQTIVKKYEQKQQKNIDDNQITNTNNQINNHNNSKKQLNKNIIAHQTPKKISFVSQQDQSGDNTHILRSQNNKNSNKIDGFKMRTQKNSKRKAKSILHIQSSLLNLTVNQFQKYQTDQNPYYVETKKLRQKLKKIQQQNKLQQKQQSLNKSQYGKIIHRKNLFLFHQNSKSILRDSISQDKKNSNTDNFRIKKIINNKNGRNQQGKIQQDTETISPIPVVQLDYGYTFNIEQIPLGVQPTINNNQLQLLKIAKDTFYRFGILIQEDKSIIIKKFKNCVLFIIDQEKNIVWHFQGRFYLGGWIMNLQGNNGGEKSGEGYQYVPNKYIYKGQFKNNKRQGKGTIRINNGTIYAGDWHQGNKHGEGKQKDQTGIYQGSWLQGKKDGQGRITLNNSNYIFEGTFVKGLKNGYGIEYFENGDSYKGDYFNGKFHGLGVYTWNTQAIYEGQFKQGLRHGKGIWTSANGNQFYEGEYEKNQKSGYGTYKWADESQYQGYFIKDMQDGEGKFTSAKGDTVECIWKQGKIVKKFIGKIRSKSNIGMKSLVKQKPKSKQKAKQNSSKNFHLSKFTDKLDSLIEPNRN